MKYYSTNHTAPLASLHEAVVRGLAPDRGLYMPERIRKLPAEFFDRIDSMSFQKIAYHVLMHSSERTSLLRASSRLSTTRSPSPAP